MSEVIYPNLLTNIASLIIIGFCGGLFIRKLGVPMVTGYMLSGVLMGPHVLNLITGEAIDTLSYVTDFVLGLIAFSIGEELQIKKLIRLGKRVVIITLAHVLGTWLMVTIGFLLIGKPFYYAFLLGAIATSTAPAATLMVIKEYRAEGSLVEFLLATIVLADILSLISFGIANSVAHAVLGGEASLLDLFGPILHELGGSLLLGVLMGLLLRNWIDWTDNEDHVTIGVFGIIALTCGLAEFLHISSLLSNMVCGVLIMNFAAHHHRAFLSIKRADAPLYVIFFALAGTVLHLEEAFKLGWLGIVYILGRSLGKWGGTWLGTVVTDAEPKIRKYLGPALLPQAGVAIGFGLIVQQEFPGMGAEILTVVFAAVIFFEIVGPIMSTIAIKRSGEAYQKQQHPTGMLTEILKKSEET